jgi:hypothetical protein
LLEKRLFDAFYLIICFFVLLELSFADIMKCM